MVDQLDDGLDGGVWDAAEALEKLGGAAGEQGGVAVAVEELGERGGEIELGLLVGGCVEPHEFIESGGVVVAAVGEAGTGAVWRVLATMFITMKILGPGPLIL